jgi:hypothetical protein
MSSGPGLNAPSPAGCLFVHAGTQLGAGQLRQLVLGEAERLDQSKMLGRADEFGELLVELVDELGILVAKAEAAVALDVLARDRAERIGLLEAGIAAPGRDDLADREARERKGIGSPGLDRGGPAALSGTTSSWLIGTPDFWAYSPSTAPAMTASVTSDFAATSS